ncbi:sensory box histidine kinase [Pseudomonas aeruginosa]|nr:sensory box histidine kinase [Pseudomonas aeruginosa]
MLRRCCLLFFCLLLSLPVRAEESVALPLTAELRTWLAEHRELRVGVVTEAPYAQYDRRLQQYSGANVELMGWLATAMQVTLRWQGYPDQAALDDALRAGRVDIAPGLSQTPAGLRLWLFSDPYLRVSRLVVGKRDGSGSVELEQLERDTRVAVRAGSSVADYLSSTYSSLQWVSADSEREVLRAVLAGQARYAVIDEAQLSRLTREPEFAELAVVGDIGYPQLLRVATRRDWPELAMVVDQALRSLPRKSLDQLHERWLQPKYPRLGESPGFWQNLSILLGLLLAGALAAVFLQRRQQHALEARLYGARRDLELRQAAEEALRLTQFSIDNSTLGILWVNWDSRVRYANRAAEQMLGHADGQLVDRPLADFEPGLDMDRWLNLWRRARNSEEGPLSFETRCLRADGSWLPADVSLSFLRFGTSEYLVVFLSDVTERRRAREALQESEARMKGIASNVPGMVFRLERPRAGAFFRLRLYQRGQRGAGRLQRSRADRERPRHSWPGPSRRPRALLVEPDGCPRRESRLALAGPHPHPPGRIALGRHQGFGALFRGWSRGLGRGGLGHHREQADRTRTRRVARPAPRAVGAPGVGAGGGEGAYRPRGP